MSFITTNLSAHLEQGIAKNIYIQLIDAISGLPILGATSYDVTISLLKSNGVDFVEKILVDPPYEDFNFSEVVNGFYRLTLDVADLDTLGVYIIHVAPRTPTPCSPIPQPQFPYMLEQYLMTDVKPQALVTMSNPDTCIIFGNVKDLTGTPSDKKCYAVKAQLIELPTVKNFNYLTVDPITIYTDINGFFQIRLAQGALVIIEIAQAGYRRQLTIPALASCELSQLPGA